MGLLKAERVRPARLRDLDVIAVRVLREFTQRGREAEGLDYMDYVTSTPFSLLPICFLQAFVIQ